VMLFCGRPRRQTVLAFKGRSANQRPPPGSPPHLTHCRDRPGQRTRKRVSPAWCEPLALMQFLLGVSPGSA
jgi:hypothetical protein